MKFLDSLPELELLSQALSFSSPSLKVTTRIEAFSCKPVGRDRKLLKAMEHDIVSDMELSASISPPDDHSHLDSAFGPLDKRCNRKTMWMLISTLNLAFPDYDFSNVSPDSFNREPNASSVLTSLSNALNHLRSSAASPSASLYRSFSSYTPGGEAELGGPHAAPTHPFLRSILDPVIGLDECEVYSYAPDVESDPHAAESEFGSAVNSEIDDSETMTERGEEDMFPMDGFGTPSNSVPPTPLATHARKLRSGKAYLTGAQSFANLRRPLRSRSGTPLTPAGEESSTGGFLWSCNYFFLNRSRKRMLFISHHMRRLFMHPLSPALGIENSYPATFDAHFKTPSRPNLRTLGMHKRRGSSTSLVSSRMDGAKRFKGPEEQELDA